MRKGMEKLGIDIPIHQANKHCLKKLKFPDKNTARDFAIRGHKKYGGLLGTPYKCKLCTGWHLSTVPKKHLPNMRDTVARSGFSDEDLTKP